MKEVRVDVTGCYLERTGICARDLQQFAPRLEAARHALLTHNETHDWAQRFAAEYDTSRWESSLYRVLKGAHRLRDRIDATVVVGHDDWTLAARALHQACSDPYFNEHDRGERGARQRLYFAGDDLDNDALQGLTRLLEQGKQSDADVDGAGRWALLTVADQVPAPECEWAFEHLAAALQRQLGDAAESWPDYVVPIVGGTHPFAERLWGMRREHAFALPDGMPPHAAWFSAAALLPAAMLGADVVRFLRGAMTMRERFLKMPVGDNPVLDWIGIQYLLERRCGVSSRVLSVWANALSATATWQRRLADHAPRTPGRRRWREVGAATGGLADRRHVARQLADDEMLTQWCVGEWRSDPAAAGAEQTLPSRMHAALAETRDELRAAGRPQVEIWMPRVDESALGQLVQLALLAESLDHWLHKLSNPRSSLA